MFFAQGTMNSLKKVFSLSVVVSVALCVIFCMSEVSCQQEGQVPTWRSTEDMRAFFRWLASNGMHDIKLDWDPVQRLVVTADDVNEGDVLITMPETLSINYNKLLSSDVKFCLNEKDMDPKACMLLYFLYESEKTDSFWSPYIKILPKDFSYMPLFWNGNDVNELQSPLTIDRLVREAEGIRGEWANVQKLIQAHPEVFGEAPERYTFDKWVWTCMIWQTRAFQEEDSEVFQLLPLVDMLDHSGNVSYVQQVKFHWEKNSPKYFSLTLGRAISKGQHPFVTYGALNNIKLLDRYGFVLEDNPNEYIDLAVPYLWRNESAAEVLAAKEKMLAELSVPKTITLVKDFKAMQKIFAGMRIGEITDDEYKTAVEKNMNSDFLGFKVELRVHRALLGMVEGILDSFPTTAAEDEELLKAGTLSANGRTAVINRKDAKELLEAVRVYTMQQWLGYVLPTN